MVPAAPVAEQAAHRDARGRGDASRFAQAPHSRRHGPLPGTSVSRAGGAALGPCHRRGARLGPAGLLPTPGASGPHEGLPAGRRAGASAEMGGVVQSVYQSPRVTGKRGQTMERADVVVIGAGVSGLSSAFWLTKAGMDVLVLDKG